MDHGDLNVCPEVIGRGRSPRMFGPGKNYHRNPQNNVEETKKRLLFPFIIMIMTTYIPPQT